MKNQKNLFQNDKEPKVYVGNFEYPFGRMLMTHMASPNVDALHKMADQIGLNRKWFQDHPKNPHYDISKSLKKKAIALGAIEVSDKVLVKKCFPELQKLMEE